MNIIVLKNKNVFCNGPRVLSDCANNVYLSSAPDFGLDLRNLKNGKLIIPKKNKCISFI